MKRRNRLFFLGLVLGIFTARSARNAEPDRLGVEFFEKNVRPVLVQHCYECHSDKKLKGGLRLDTRDGWSQGGDNGPAIVPGNPDDSLLIQAVRYGGDYEMPPKGKLPAAVINVLERWVALGAPDPRLNAAARHSTVVDMQAGRQHWSYRPVRSPSVPAVRDEGWPRSDIDRFILSKLEASQLSPSLESDRIVLVRRLYLDLLGLPPTIEEIDEFLQDSRSDAYAKLVERLLSSPRFGERWGRHWLDVARFAESMTLRGFVFQEAWRYRDYVLAALNQDRPFDLFIREQIAGDLLPAETRADRERQLVATTYLALGNTNLEEQDKKQLEMDVIDEQLDVLGKGILAQTLTCARCHDHKFDPISQRDYYALAGILRNTKVLEHSNVSKWIETPLPVEPQREELFRRHDAAVAALRDKLQSAKNAVKAASTTSAATTTNALVLAPTNLPGIVVDDRQAKRVGEWKESQHTKGYVGDGYLHDLNQDQGQKTLTFVPELPRDGKYEVRFAYTPAKNRATSVKVTVFCADGEKTITIDETEPPPLDGHFISLGQFQFQCAGQSFVILSNEGTKGFVCADAVQFLPAEMSADSTAKPAVEFLSPAKTAPVPGQLAVAEADLKRLEVDLKKLTAAAPYRPMAMTVLEQKEISDGRINIRGVVHNLGEQVPRGFLQVCSSGAPATMPRDQSGRLELAAWLGSPDNPLTARVMVNRIWHSLFGVGIVRTVDNFGLTGELPSHPELLDYLARRFMDRGWSVKEMVREIVLSRTYCQASIDSELGGRPSPEVDPENRLLWKANRRRLDAECLRDAMLLVSGELRLEVGGPSFPRELTADYGFQHTGTRRSVYEPVFRNSLLEILEAFDFADPSLVTGRRSTSTVAPQALFLMNHPSVLENSRLAAQRLLVESAAGDGQRVDVIFRKTLGRLPSAHEKQASLAFLAQSDAAGTSDARLHAWAQLCQSLFASIDFRYVE